MIRRTCLLSILILILAALPLPALAQENLPPAQQNWCYNPNIWEGDCGDGDTFLSEWMWTCGWYMAGFNRGAISREFIRTHTFCAILLPPLPPPSSNTVLSGGTTTTPPLDTDIDPVVPTTFCYDPVEGNSSLFYDAGNPDTLDNAADFDVLGCDGLGKPRTVVTADSQAVADELCAILLETEFVFVYPVSQAFLAPENLWFCQLS